MMRGQAAIFDGIMFLMFASASVALVFYFLGSYGVAQDNVIRSAYNIEYVQNAGKALFSLQAKTLAPVGDRSNPIMVSEANWCDPEYAPCDSSGVGKPYANLMAPGVPSPYQGCESLAESELYTVADLLKKDLGDFMSRDRACYSSSDPDRAGQVQGSWGCTCFDDRYGRSDASSTNPCIGVEGAPKVYGKLALRCALKELMKPYHYSGFKYFAYVHDTYIDKAIKQPAFDLSKPDSWRVTNHWQANDEGWESCSEALAAGYDLMTIAIPFRVPVTNRLVDDNEWYSKCILHKDLSGNPYAPTPEEANGICKDQHSPRALVASNYEIRVCVWASKKQRAGP